MTTASENPPLAIVEWNVGGHHDGYLKLYVGTLLRQQRRLVALVRDAQALRLSLAGEGGDAAIAAGKLVIAQIPAPAFLEEKKRWRRQWGAWRYGRKVASLLAQAERTMGERCAQVFFACLYDHQVQLSATLAHMLRRPWSGLYLQAIAFHQPGRKVPRLQRNFPIQRLFAVPRMKGLLMLDESIADKVARATGRRVVIAPDVADGPWLTEHPLAMQCRQRAGAAPLVGLLGHLLPSKGITTLAEIALRDDAQDLAYLFAGEIYWTMFKPAQKEIIERAMRSARTAIFIAQRVPDSAAFNALVAVCDVLFAAYHDFPHSSNMLTLAAFLEKPIVVSEGRLMAQRVRDYRLGEVVPQADPAAALEALRRVTRDPAAWRAARQPRWREYRERHSAAALDGALRELLAIRPEHG